MGKHLNAGEAGNAGEALHSTAERTTGKSLGPLAVGATFETSTSGAFVF